MSVPVEMRWRDVLFENWPVAPAAVRARLPGALTVDTFEGDAWLSVVPFVNDAVRPRGLPATLGLELPELNLRTYVTCDGRPGVYFFSLDAEGLLGVLGARLLNHLPYYYARIRADAVGDRIWFDSRRRHPGARPAVYTASYGPDGVSFPAPEDDLARFLVERYRYYTQAPDGTVRYADVDHDPWTLVRATADVERNSLFEANGFEAPAGRPVRYYSADLAVTATASRRWDSEGRR
jgi:uncharacterized protein YqjF (DUF2071 family)